jgi:hypothetical protein
MEKTNMKRLLGVASALLVVAFTAVGCKQMTEMYDSVMDTGWTTLIDGEKGLDNFNRVGNTNWAVVDGVIQADKRTSKTPAFLVTKNSYKDFEIRVEFWASHDANSGIFMRCQNPSVITDKSCYEANIFDQRKDPTYGTGGIVHFAAVSPMPKAGGKWNVYEITAKGDHIVVVLNGAKTVELRHSAFASGPIALQHGAGVIKFRKVQIKPL